MSRSQISGTSADSERGAETSVLTWVYRRRQNPAASFLPSPMLAGCCVRKGWRHLQSLEALASQRAPPLSKSTINSRPPLTSALCAMSCIFQTSYYQLAGGEGASMFLCEKELTLNLANYCFGAVFSNA